MWMMLLAAAMVGAIAYVWCLRGFFSALLHLVCVVAAGAIAFGLWEPVAYLIIDVAPERGWGTVLLDAAWGVGLALPFVLALALLRTLTDVLVPANAQCDPTVDYIGGGICGVLSGVISAGIVVLSLGFLRLPPDLGGYQPVIYTSGKARGTLQRNPDTFVPWVDRLTADLYGRLSLTTLRTDTPLARLHPSLDAFAGALRMTYEGQSRTTLRPDAFSVLGWYVVGDRHQPARLSELLWDSWSDIPQHVADLEGRSLDNQPGYLAGFAIKFNSKAREKQGTVLAGTGQIRLVCQHRDDEDDVLALHPIAIVTNVDDPTRVAYARFRFDSDNLFISSVGGAADVWMTFEFAIPAAYEPLALYVKGVRWNVREERPEPDRVFAGPLERDDLIRAGGMGGMEPVRTIPAAPGTTPVQTQVFQDPPISVGNTLGFTIRKGTEQGLEVVEATRGWAIVEGEQKFKTSDIRGSGGLDQKLQVNKFHVGEDTGMVRLNLSPGRRSPEFNRKMEAADRNAAPVLVDHNGTRYEPVGWIYKDRSLYWVRYTRGQPISRLGDLPSVSRATSDRELTLLFVVNRGVRIVEFRVGDELIEEYRRPAIEVSGPGR